MLELYYAYSEIYGGWALTYMEDAVLENQLGSKRMVSSIKDGIEKKYWIVTTEGLRRILGLLTQIGYTLHPKSTRRPDGTPNVVSAEGERSANLMIKAVAKTNVKDAPLGSSANPYDVAKLAAFVSEKIKNTFGKMCVWVVGELSGWKEGKATSFYYPKLIQPNANGADPIKFNTIVAPSIWRKIKDKCQIEGVPLPKNGDKICALCEIDFYEKTTTLQLKIQDIDLDYSQGDFFRQKALIIGRLVQEGLFDLNRNLPVPVLPKRIAVFSNEGAAGYYDFHNKLQENKIPVTLTIFRVVLQGTGMEPSVIKALSDMENYYPKGYFDYGVIIRGGGDTTELACFNNYNVASAIARCHVKFMVAIGHDIDSTVLDEMLVRCKTPTDAADKISTIYRDADDEIQDLSLDLIDAVHDKIERYDKELIRLGNQILTTATWRKSDAENQLNHLSHLLCSQARMSVEKKKVHQEQLSEVLVNTVRGVSYNEMQRLRLMRETIGDLTHAKLEKAEGDMNRLFESMSFYVKTHIDNKMKELNNYAQLVDARDPRAMIKRGFVCLSKHDGQRITTIHHIKKGENVRATLIDGHLDLTVNTVLENKDGNEKG